MQTDTQRLGGICERLRRLVRLSREDLEKKEARLQALEAKLQTSTPEQAAVLKPLIADLESDIAFDRIGLETLELDVRENCGGL